MRPPRMTTRGLMIVVALIAGLLWIWNLEYVESTDWRYTWMPVRTRTCGDWLLERIQAGLAFLFR